MTGTIISLHGDQHDQVNALLPWYVTDRLDEDDRARVEAHLAGCQTCQADLVAERRLKSLIHETAAGRTDADAGFARLMAEIDAEPRGAGTTARRSVVRQWQTSPGWMRWAVAAQLLLLVGGGVALGVAVTPRAGPQYHALSAPAQPRPGNVVVVFRPDAKESEIRSALRTGHARLVDGPTAADAYVLSVPVNERGAALQALRADTVVVVAEPLDGEAR
jgi:anti-sigma factor RsiW